MFYYNYLYEKFTYYAALGWSIAALVGVIFSSIFIIQYLCFFAGKKLSKRSIIFKLINAIKNPLIMLIIAFVIFSCIEAAYVNAKTLLFSIKTFNYYTFFKFTVSFSIAWFIINFIKLTERELIRYQEKLKGLVEINFVSTFSLIARIIVIVVSLFHFLNMAGVNIKTLLTFGGIGGIIIGLAAKDLFGNFLGIIMVNFDRIFNIDDTIVIPSLEIEGIVEHIGWRLTMIRQFDKIPIHVPNAVFINAAVRNLSQRTHRFFNENILVKHSNLDKLNSSLDVIKMFLKSHVDIDSINESVIVRVTNIDHIFANINVRCYITKIDWFAYCDIMTDLFAGIKKLLSEKFGHEIFLQNTNYQMNIKDNMNNEKECHVNHIKKVDN